MFTSTCITIYSIILHYELTRSSYLNQLPALTRPKRGPVTYGHNSPVYHLSSHYLGHS